MKMGKIKIMIIVLIVVIIALSSLYLANFYNTRNSAVKTLIQASVSKRVIEKMNHTFYTCMNTEYVDETTTELFNELLTNLDTSKVSIYFEDLNNNYTLTLNENVLYYNASIIKLFDAAYIIDNNVDLEDTITFTSYYYSFAKEGLSSYKVNSEIPIKDILYYAISVSDNAAHLMLIDYIGIDNLKEYAKKTLDINLTITSSDLFGNLSVSSTNKLLKHIYELLQNDSEYSTLLKEAMDNDYYNALNFDDITFLHKYGYYNNYFHDIGIYYNSYPYTLSIFTLYGNPDTGALETVSNISKEIYNIYQYNLSKKKEYCYALAYS